MCDRDHNGQCILYNGSKTSDHIAKYVVVVIVSGFATRDCVATYVDHILHRDRFWAISIASGSVRLWDLRSCCMVLM